MFLVERHIIKQTHQHWQEIDKLSFLSKNLYNAANYICRQYFFATGKKYKLAELYHLVKNSVDYRALPTKVSKQIVKRLVSTWTGYFEAHKEWNKCPSKFLGEPRIPGYKHKTKGRNAVIYYHESVYKAELKQGICHLGKQNNQSFTHIPHAKFIDQLTYKCQLAGIKVIVTEESYTSKTSALDLESPCQHETYLGKRVKRGLFQSHSGIKINADINGSLQIARKVFPNAYTAEGIARAAVAPLKVLPL